MFFKGKIHEKLTTVIAFVSEGHQKKIVDILTSFLKYHLGLQLGLENTASNVTFLSLPSLAYWSTRDFKKDSFF